MLMQTWNEEDLALVDCLGILATSRLIVVTVLTPSDRRKPVRQMGTPCRQLV